MWVEGEADEKKLFKNSLYLCGSSTLFCAFKKTLLNDSPLSSISVGFSSPISRYKSATVLMGQDKNYYAYYCDEGQLYHMVRKDGESSVENTKGFAPATAKTCQRL